MSNSAASRESFETPTSTPLTCAMSTLSAAPTWSTTRSPSQAAGSSNVRSWMPVGLLLGNDRRVGPGRASGRWCTAAGPRCPASSTTRDDRVAPAASSTSASGRSEELEPPGCRPARGGPRAGRCACGPVPDPRDPGRPTAGPSAAAGSPFRRPERQATDELTLERDEHDDRRQRHEQRCRRQQIEVREELPWRLFNAAVIGRRSPVFINTSAQKKSF